jgi:hypothetical protein
LLFLGISIVAYTGPLDVDIVEPASTIDRFEVDQSG